MDRHRQTDTHQTEDWPTDIQKIGGQTRDKEALIHRDNNKKKEIQRNTEEHSHENNDTHIRSHKKGSKETYADTK